MTSNQFLGLVLALTGLAKIPKIDKMEMQRLLPFLCVFDTFNEKAVHIYLSSSVNIARIRHHGHFTGKHRVVIITKIVKN